MHYMKCSCGVYVCVHNKERQKENSGSIEDLCVGRGGGTDNGSGYLRPQNGGGWDCLNVGSSCKNGIHVMRILITH